MIKAVLIMYISTVKMDASYGGLAPYSLFWNTVSKHTCLSVLICQCRCALLDDFFFFFLGRGGVGVWGGGVRVLCAAPHEFGCISSSL